MQRGQLNSVICTLMIFTIASYGLAFAAEKKKNKTAESSKSERIPKEEKQPYATNSFDAKVISLPPDYFGHDIVALYERLASAFPPKDEFESTEAYRKRLEGTYPQDIFAFVLENPLAMVTASYDPDVQSMAVKINADRATNLDGFQDKLRRMRESKTYENLLDYDESVIVTKHISGPTKEYEAGNKLGAKTIVTEHTGREFGIGLINKDSFARTEKYSIRRERNINFKISPEKGRDLKTNLGILLVCKVKLGGAPPAHSFKSFYHAKPTMDSPTELSFQQFFVNVDLFELWVFNKKTGTVYAKEIIMPLPEEQQKAHGDEKI